MKIVFFGTSNFSRLVAEKILNSDHNIVAIVAQPDKVNGRNNKVTFNEMKVFALEHNIPIYQFAKLNLEGEEILKSLNADLFVTASYGQIIKQNILDICPIINVHGSLLPKYRGPAPIQWCLINGETKTGVTIMRTELGLDCGEMYLKKELEILPTDTCDTLFEKLGVLGGEAIVEFLDNYKDLICKGIKQNEEEKSYFPMLTKEMSLLDFNQSSIKLVNLIRGLSTCNTAYFLYNNLRYKVLFASAVEGNGNAGIVLEASAKKGLIIATSEGALRIETIQPEGKKPMSAKDFCNSGKIKVGDFLNN